MSIDRKCSRRGCRESATRVRNRTTAYCDYHYRLSVMSQNSIVSRGDGMTFRAVEALYEAQGRPSSCPCCKRAFTWHSDEGGLGTVISLQHKNDGTLSFLCYTCNTGHGHSALGDDYLKLDPGKEKYCCVCQTVKALTDFYWRRGVARGWCKSCTLDKQRRPRREHA